MQRTTDTLPHNHIALRRRRLVPAAAARVALEQAGQALVEFALILPLLLVAAFLVVHVGLAQNSAHDQEHIADEVAQYARADRNPGAPGLTLQEWAKKQGDNDIAKKGKVCISFPKGPIIGEPVTVEFTSTMKWLPDLSGGNLISVLKGVTNFTIKQTATEPLYQVPEKVKAGCA